MTTHHTGTRPTGSVEQPRSESESPPMLKTVSLSRMGIAHPRVTIHLGLLPRDGR